MYIKQFHPLYSQHCNYKQGYSGPGDPDYLDHSVVSPAFVVVSNHHHIYVIVIALLEIVDYYNIVIGFDKSQLPHTQWQDTLFTLTR